MPEKEVMTKEYALELIELFGEHYVAYYNNHLFADRLKKLIVFVSNDEAIKQEREACAKIVDEMRDEMEPWMDGDDLRNREK